MNISIIPRPNYIEIHEGRFAVGDKIKIVCENSLIPNAKIALGSFASKAIFTEGTPKKEPYIELDLINNISFDSNEYYEMYIERERIRIKAYTFSGIFYALISLSQLMAGNPEAIPCLVIKDSPVYNHRGFMLDVSRHFFGKETVKRILDLLCFLKINRFHWHLTDDQGWRVEIKKFPFLTEKGSKRAGTYVSGRFEKEEVNGFYTQEDIKDIISYAAERFITVIPEIDMPGHSLSALASYKELGCSESGYEVSERFGIIKDIMCAGKESTYEFVFGVLDELSELFQSEYIHIGSDEVPKDRWRKCEYCKGKIKDFNLKDEEQLQSYFINRVAAYLKTRNKKAIVWNDALKSGILDDEITVQHWLDRNKNYDTINSINCGRNTIISDFFNYYFDYPYGMTPLRKVYNFDPVFKGVLPENEKNILGVEAALWTEYVKTEERLFYMICPRLFAVGETGWTYKNNKNYNDFLLRLEALQPYIENAGINYAGKDEYDIKGFRAKREVLNFFMPIIKNMFHTAKKP